MTGERTQDHLVRALRVAGIGSWEWNVVTNRVVWSDELYRIFGVAPDAFAASYEAYLAAIHPADRDRVNAAVMESCRTGAAYELEHRVNRPDGELCIVQCRGEVTVSTDGVASFMVGTAQDVTEERVRAMKLAEAERQLKEAQRLARLGSWRYDVSTQASEWSEVMYELYGYDSSQYKPSLDSFLSRAHPDDAEEVRVKLTRAAEEGVGWESDLRVVWPNGEERVLHGRAEVDFDEQGKPVVVRGTRQDVTEPRREQARLRAAEEQFRLAFENAPIGMAVVAPNGRFLRVNAALCAIVGYSAELLLELSFQDITHPEDLDADVSLMRSVLDGTAATYEIEKRYVRRDLSPVWVQLSVSLVRADDGRPMHFISQIQDVSARREADERLRNYVAKIEASTLEAAAAPVPEPARSSSGPRRVLLAEDNAVNQFVARAMLQRLGWEVTVVDNGQEALGALAIADFDVVILDCQMPVLDGYSAARAIRGLQGPKSRLPIVAMTASAREEDRQRCLAAGMDEFIAKPITKQMVGDMLERVVHALA